MTFPQILHLGDGVHDEGDPLLNAWAMAWVAHQLPRAPAHLFDANIFSPERRTLAFSETLIAPAALTAPLQWLGFGPLLVYNLVLLSGFIVSGAGTALLVRTLTGRSGAGIVAGIVFAFLPFRFDHLPHLQLQQTQFLPLVMWAFHRLLARGRLRDGVLVGACAAGQVLSCFYYGIFLLPYLAVVCGTLIAAEPSALGARVAPLCLAGAIVAAAVTPVGMAYLGARQVVGERGSGEVELGSATPENYLAPSPDNVLYGARFGRFAAPERRLFPGFLAVGLAIVGIVAPFGQSPARSRVLRLAYGLGLALAVDMSLGFNGLSYRALYDHLLLFHALRIPARMAIFAEFSLAILAGLGAAAIAQRIQRARLRQAALVLLAGAMLVEYAALPVTIEVLPVTPPQAYRDLLRDKGDSPTATLFEFPLSPRDDTIYMLYSTFHWQRLINGYSGFFPPSYISLYDAIGNFADERSMDAIKRRQTRYLVVHGERLLGARYETLIPVLDRRPDLKLVSRTPAERPGQHGEISVYRVLYDDPR